MDGDNLSARERGASLAKAAKAKLMVPGDRHPYCARGVNWEDLLRWREVLQAAARLRDARVDRADRSVRFSTSRPEMGDVGSKALSGIS